MGLWRVPSILLRILSRIWLLNSGNAPVTIAVIDDNRLVREALTAILGSLENVNLVAAAEVDTKFLAEHKPDVVLLDVGLRDEDALGIATALKKKHPRTKIVMMDLIPADEDIASFVNAGVDGFVLKEASVEEFVQTIRAVVDGEKVLPASMTESLFSQIAKKAYGRDRTGAFNEVRMTKRELEMIQLIGLGLSNSEIAERLDVATHTVKSHVRNVMEKLALHTRLQIAAYAHSQGKA